jgi:predicted DNA-binding WGR domain protein
VGHAAISSPEAIELVKVSPAKRQTRFYRPEIWPDLFGGFSLVREYGRIGQPGRLQLDPFPEIDSARKAFARLVSRKQRRGYVPSVMRFRDDGKPLQLSLPEVRQHEIRSKLTPLCRYDSPASAPRETLRTAAPETGAARTGQAATLAATPAPLKDSSGNPANTPD